jgi:hypothetical protein
MPQRPEEQGGIGAWFHRQVGERFHRHHVAIALLVTVAIFAYGVLQAQPRNDGPPGDARSNPASSDLVSSVQPSGASSSAVATRTQVIPFRPYTDRDQLAAQFEVGARVAGQCDQPSRTTSSTAAMRCIGEDSTIRDPCWSNITLEQVA